MAKTRLKLTLDQDLVDFVKVFAAENGMTVADVVTQHFLALRHQVDRETTEGILARPVFRPAMVEAQDRLRSGAAEWFTFEDVFGD